MEAEKTSFRNELIGAGLIVALGVTVIVVGAGYRMGTLTSMGAGYVPVVIGAMMVFVGILMAATEYASRGKVATGPSLLPEVGKLPAAPGEGAIQWRGWLCILGGVAAFVVAGAHLGLVAAIFLAVFISALGDRENTLRGCLVLALAITVPSVLLFNLVLKVPFPLFTWG